MSTSPAPSQKKQPFPVKHCTSCGLLRQIRRKSRLTPGLCRSCYDSMESKKCKRCNYRRHLVDDNTGLCPKCLSRPEGECSRCLLTRPIFNKEDKLCRKCHEGKIRVLRRRARRVKIECSVCGRYKSAEPLVRDKPICGACYREEYNGKAICKRCGKFKAIHHKKEVLCAPCKSDFHAADSLRKYISGFSTAHHYNEVLFDLLVERIDWENVNQSVNRRFRNFGNFLQTVQIPQPLTWETIYEIRPDRGTERWAAASAVRRCLRDLGDLMVTTGKLEDWATYLLRRRVLLLLNHAPEPIRDALESFVAWQLEEHCAKLSTVERILRGILDFWSWCVKCSLKTLTEVQPAHVRQDYLHSLYWQWRCSLCNGILLFERRNAPALTLCPYCSAARSLVKVQRYDQKSVSLFSLYLRTFFHWAKERRLILTDLGPPKVKSPRPPTRQYTPEVIKNLCAEIPLPEVDPVEALTLYLIIFYGFTMRELRYAQVPMVFPVLREQPYSTLSQSYYIIMPKPLASVGNPNPGRAGNRVDFQSSAAPWLVPLLERFEEHRRSVVQKHYNEYLFVDPRSVRRNTPVSNRVVRQVIRRASLRIIGADCKPQLLRITAMRLLADFAGGSVLHRFGVQSRRAFNYNLVPMEVVVPEKPGDLWMSNRKGRRIPILTST